MKQNPFLIGIIVVLGLVLIIAGLGSSSLSGDQIGNLVYAGLLLTLMSSFVIGRARGNLSETVLQLLIWASIFAAVALAYNLKGQFGF